MSDSRRRYILHLQALDGALFYPLGPCNASEIVELKREMEQFSVKLQPAGKALHVGMYFSHMGGCEEPHSV